MADIIGLGLSVIDIANYIRDTVDDVKGFPDRSKRLSGRIDSLLPAVRLLQDSVVAEEVRKLDDGGDHGQIKVGVLWWYTGWVQICCKRYKI